MSDLKWYGPHSFRDLVMEYDLRPPFDPGVYAVTSDLSMPTPENVLYIGRSKHLGERFGDLAFGLLRLTAPGGWQFHGAAERVMLWCDEHGVDYLSLGYAWVLAGPSRSGMAPLSPAPGPLDACPGRPAPPLGDSPSPAPNSCSSMAFLRR